ncbi:MAG: hypothetical protein EOO99_11990 [Pedobacter sp.]|nr:MAG: hypothetical protein EOO99_11990 [Pedobacter sp.]
MFDTDLHKYSNANGTMTFEDKKHADEYRTAIRRHEGCLLIQPALKDKKLYRLFMINPLAFWRWRLYFTKEYYKFPYKNWKEIEKNRVPVPMPEKGYCIIDF